MVLNVQFFDDVVDNIVSMNVSVAEAQFGFKSANHIGSNIPNRQKSVNNLHFHRFLSYTRNLYPDITMYKNRGHVFAEHHLGNI